MTQQTEIKRVISKLQSLESERGPSMILDEGDAKILLDHLEHLEHFIISEWNNEPVYILKR